MLIMLAAQTDKIASQTLDTLTDLAKAGVIGVAIFAILAVILIIYFGGKIINRLLDFLNRVTQALEKLSDQAEAQNTLVGELAVSMKDNKESVEKVVKQIRINTKVTKDYFMAETSRLEIITRGFNAADIHFRQRIRDVEALIHQTHTEAMAALAAMKPQTSTTIVLPTQTEPTAIEKTDLLEAKTESEKPP